MQELVNTVKAMEGQPVMVIGDLMLDMFVYGEVERISPESPVPVLTIAREDVMLGGAGNVLTNLCALKLKPYIFAVVGQDKNAERISGIAIDLGIDVSGIVSDESRPTTLKTRYLARHQQLLRTDFEKTHALSPKIEQDLLAKIEKKIRAVRAVVLSDYGKGVLTKSLLQKVIATARAAGVPILVDPKGKDYSIYRGADIVTPNRKELAEASGYFPLKTDSEILAAAQKIIADCGIECVVATRSEDGMSLVRAASGPVHLKTQAREVFDVSGAGDTVIATLAASLAAGVDIETGARLANIAGGIAVSKVGTTPVRAEEILHVLQNQEADNARQAKLSSVDKALEQVRKWQAQGLKVGFTNGCFDILHTGHVNYLGEARSKCDRLIVGLNHDDSVRILKGPQRPVNDEQARAAVLGALACVDMVVFFGARKAGEDNTPSDLIQKLRPDIFFKGGDYRIETLPEAKIVQAYGGEVAIMAMHEGFSTTAILERSGKVA